MFVAGDELNMSKTIILSTYSFLSNYVMPQINEIVRLILLDLMPRIRITLISLIVLDVHSRDILKELIDAEINTCESFVWLCQLRYYYSESALNACMVDTSFPYGFEYLGNTPRLVVTPLTDRCYRTLLGAYKLNLGGSPEVCLLCTQTSFTK